MAIDLNDAPRQRDGEPPNSQSWQRRAPEAAPIALPNGAAGSNGAEQPDKPIQEAPSWQAGRTEKRARNRWREILPQLGIDTRFLKNEHGPCPLCGGTDRYRFDDLNGTGSYYCNQCGSGRSGIILLSKLHNWSYAEACAAVDKTLGDDRSAGRKTYQRHDATSLLDAPAEARDHTLPIAYLAHRLGVLPAAVPLSVTRMVGHKALGYFDPPPQRSKAKPTLVGEWPCAVFETVAADGRTHAHRIYLAPGGAGKAELPVMPDGKPRDAKKSATKAKGDNIAGCSVLWGDPERARWLIVTEGIENGAAVALAFAAEIEAGRIVVAAAISAAGIKAFQPYPATERVTVAADRDEAPSRTASRAGEPASRQPAPSVQSNIGGSPSTSRCRARPAKKSTGSTFCGAIALRLYAPGSRRPKSMSRGRASRAATRKRRQSRGNWPMCRLVISIWGRADCFSFDPGSDPDKPKPPTWLSEAFEILALTRDAHGTSWGTLLRWRDRDGRAHEWAMPAKALGGNRDEVWREMLDRGLSIASAVQSRNKLAEYLSSARVDGRARAVARIGWHTRAEAISSEGTPRDGTPGTPAKAPGVPGKTTSNQLDHTRNTRNTENRMNRNENRVFVLPDQTFGDTDNERVLWQTEARETTAYNIAGAVNDWREAVALRSVGNTWLAFAVSAAFAPPLLFLAGEESGGFHFVGSSRTEKTTVLRTAGSVWGGGGGITGYLRSWRATANGLEGIAVAHCDTLLCLDEMGQIEAREAGESAYMLANGSGKGRARRDGSARQTAQWRTLFLSSGEISLADKMAEIGRRPRAGQEIRLVDIPVDAGKGFGAFDQLHGSASAGAFAEELRQATDSYYGAVIRDFLTRLVVTNSAELCELLHESRINFLSEHLPKDASGQVRSVCSRFALVAAAGSLATAMGLTGWPDGEADKAAAECFGTWLAARRTTGDHDIEAGIKQVIAYIEAHGSSRFEAAWEKQYALSGEIIERVINRAGFRRKDDNGNWQYMILPEQWHNEVTKGCPKNLAQVMADRGVLLPDGFGKLSQSITVPHEGKQRLYVLVSGIGEAGDAG